MAETGRLVTTERLIDEVWGEHPPRTALRTVQGYVFRLRRLLGCGPDGPLVSRQGGYELVVADESLDAHVFTRLVDSGRRDLTRGRPEDAISHLSAALDLWHGPALADVSATPTVAAYAARLEQARVDATEDRLAALLDLDRNDDAVGEAQRLVADHPLRERLWEQLMLALYRCGRRGEALQAYQRARKQLVAELGLEPGPQLRDLQQAILGDDPKLSRAIRGSAHVTGPVIPAQLPADAAAFTGRDTHLERLDALQLGDAGSTSAVVITTIVGAAGVGKSALAVHWAHRIQHRFPDGQLYVNLRGYGAGEPVRPVEALAGFLRALGVAAAQIPIERDEAAALYRSLLVGKRVLVVLDDACHPDQVRPLLPAGPGCLVVVTSRDRLGGLVARDGAVRLELAGLLPAEAEALLARLLGPERVGAEPDSAAELARLCGFLPLAVRIAAAKLATQPRMSIADYVARLANGDRLAALQVDGDPQAAIRAAFDHSYLALPDPARRVFRLAGLVPGPDRTAEAVAALADTEVAAVAKALDQLAAVHLLEEQAPGRYGYHDLIRCYAADQAGAEDDEADRRAALGRLFDYYLSHVHAAAARLCPEIVRLPSPASVAHSAAPGFGSDGQALAWLDAERANLVAAVVHAAGHGPYQAAWLLADGLRGYLYLRMHTVDWHTVAHAGLTAAEADGDLGGQAAARQSLARLDYLTGRFRASLDHGEQAVALAKRAGWAEGEAAALGELGAAHWGCGELDQAAEVCTQALEIDRRTGSPAGQAARVNALGAIYLRQGRLAAAADHFTQAIALHRRLGAASGEARILTNLGHAQHLLGNLGDAVATLTKALAAHPALGDRYAEFLARHNLAAVYRDTGDHPQARRLAATALTLARDTGNRLIEAEALGTLAAIHHHLGHPRRAIAGYTQVVRLLRDLDEAFSRTEALIGLAAACHHGGSLAAATGHARQALGLACQGGYRMLEGQA
ncbi:MAG: tetratricopeptide repeat protein, partial [Actinobacteria bacterium]|nr:tetratricopeptide repeat protein [Actinomycetota bacterium]